MGKADILKDSISFFEKSIKSFKQQLGDPVEYKINMMDDLIKKGLKEVSGKPSIKDYENMSRHVFSIVVNYGIFILLFSLIPYILFLFILLNVSRNWQILVAEGSPTSIKPPPVLIKSKRINILIYPLLIIWTLFSFIYNAAFAIVSIDAISYVFLNKSIIIKESAAIYSWVKTILILFSRLHHPNQEMLYIFFSKIYLLLFTIPLLFILLKWSLRFVKRNGKRIIEIFKRAESKTPLSTKVKEVISEISRRYDLKVPRIILIDQKKGLINSKMGIFATRAIITINKEIINVLNEGEIIAIIAHEMAHIKYDVRKMELLKLLSRLALFPNFFLTIFLNYRKMEERADKFAVEVIKTKNDLKNALIKISTLNMFVEKDSNKRKNIKHKGMNILNKIHVLDEFFFGEALIGYSHLGMIERLKEIEKAY
jgi:Zn-dependent protease with chaperone function